MKATRIVGLSLAAILAACSKTTAPLPATFDGSWDGFALVADSTAHPVSLVLTEDANGNLSGTGTWAEHTPLTIVNGAQENVVYAAQHVSNISLRVSSSTLGYADINGAITDGQFMGSLKWANTPTALYTVTLAR